MKRIKKTVIMTGYKCNNNCIFCYNIHKRDIPDRPTREILSDIVEAKERGTTYLEIIGGEQTIRSDIIDIIRFAKRIDFETITMTTNGAMFFYKDFVKKIIEGGLNCLVFSIHGHNANLHDSLTRVKGSFNKLLEGLKNVRSLGVGIREIGSNTTIVKQNYKFLFEIGNLLNNLGIRNSEFIFVDPTRGGPYERFHELVPRISEAAPFIIKCLNIGKESKIDHWHIRYVPLCYFIDYQEQISELYEHTVFYNTEHLAPDYRNFDVENSRKEVGRIKPKKCSQCKKYDLCEGIWIEYYKRYGDKELKPIL